MKYVTRLYQDYGGFLVAVVLSVFAAALALVIWGCGGPPFEENLFAESTRADSGGSPQTDSSSTQDGPQAFTDAAVDAQDASTSLSDACVAYGHTDGFGDYFENCTVSGEYNLTLARAACAAGGGVQCNDTSTACSVTASYVATILPGGSCREWVYSGPLVGEAYLFQEGCGCPGTDAGVTMAWR
jgi:hypothetical protein